MHAGGGASRGAAEADGAGAHSRPAGGRGGCRRGCGLCGGDAGCPEAQRSPGTRCRKSRHMCLLLVAARTVLRAAYIGQTKPIIDNMCSMTRSIKVSPLQRKLGEACFTGLSKRLIA